MIVQVSYCCVALCMLVTLHPILFYARPNPHAKALQMVFDA